MLLNSLTGWGNIRCWYRDTIWTYLQVIMNSPLFIGLTSFQPTYRCSYVFIRKSWLTQLTNRTVISSRPIFLRPPTACFLHFFDSPTKKCRKNPKPAKGLVLLWLLGEFGDFFLPQILLPKDLPRNSDLGIMSKKPGASEFGSWFPSIFPVAAACFF